MIDGLASSTGDTVDSFATIPDIPIAASTPRVQPNDVASGVTRGIQQLGSQYVYSDGGNQQIIVADTTPRALMGNQPTFGEGFYISKPGIDATTNKDPAQWIFNSNQDVFKIVKTDTVIVSADTFPATGATTGLHQTSTVIAHGLSFVPQVVASVLVGSTYTPLPSFSVVVNNGALGGFIRWDVTGYADTTNITFTITSFGNNTAASTYGPLTIRYYLLQETAS